MTLNRLDMLVEEAAEEEFEALAVAAGLRVLSESFAPTGVAELEARL